MIDTSVALAEKVRADTATAEREPLQVSCRFDALAPLVTALERRLVGQEEAIEALVCAFSRPLAGLKESETKYRKGKSRKLKDFCSAIPPFFKIPPDWIINPELACLADDFDGNGHLDYAFTTCKSDACESKLVFLKGEKVMRNEALPYRLGRQEKGSRSFIRPGLFFTDKTGESGFLMFDPTQRKLTEVKDPHY